MKGKPKILFIAIVPHGFSRFETTKYGLQRTFDLLPHKCSVLSLVAWLRENGCDGRYVWHDSIDEKGLSKFKNAIAEYKPDAIGFSLCTNEMMSHYKVIQLLKQKYPDLPVIIGGPHVSAMPEHTLEHFPLIDYVAIGDGEFTLTQWLRKIAWGQGQKEMREVHGLAFRDNSYGIVITPPREKIIDINILPDPAFDLIIPRPGSGVPLNSRTVFPIFCSFGCRFYCTFCAADHGNYRFFNPVRVVDRIESAHRQLGVQYFSILDGLWPPSREWLDEFCDEIEKRQLKIKFQFATRADTLERKHFARLKRIGAQVIVIGVEAGDPAILKRIRKGITIEKAKRAFAALNKVGIFSVANFMVGNLGENRETIQATIDLAGELNPSMALFRAHCPIPGTVAFNFVPDDEKDYWMTGDDNNDWWMGGNVPSICDLPHEELGHLAREAYLYYPLRWSYIMQHVLSRKLSPEYLRVARRIFAVHLRKYILGISERSPLLRPLIYHAKAILKN